MQISITLPGWLQRRWIASYLEKHPYIMSGCPCRSSQGEVFVVDQSAELGPEIREFIVRGMEEQGCDALTFVRTVKKFPSAKTTFCFGAGVR